MGALNQDWSPPGDLNPSRQQEEKGEPSLESRATALTMKTMQSSQDEILCNIHNLCASINVGQNISKIQIMFRSFR